ncbi:diguanylate cyclase [Shewanella acanthi]|uniref:diguanylate cyclase n=1 Tax=Shewanella acanthi TaxID=2864212 RepID=UPI001C65A07B|nr:diguanylate cyclase [Shewanella acanthi]QYJ79271.1 sensor domain-containing diguanylate cyclase [Shewanella acanthi]
MKAPFLTPFLLLLVQVLVQALVCFPVKADSLSEPYSPIAISEIPVSTAVAELNSELHSGHKDLTPFITLLEDPQGELSFEQVLDKANLGQFKTLGDKQPNFGFTTSAWWVMLTLHNPTKQSQQWYLRQDYPLIDYLDLWQPKVGLTSGNSTQMNIDDWQRISTGDRHPFNSRPLENRTFVFPLTLAPGETKSLFLRYQTEGSLNIGLEAYSTEALISQVGHEYLFMGIYYGGFVVLLVYNLIIFMTVRERAFIFYVLYVFSYGLYMSVHNGLSFQFLWPDNSWLANKSLLFLLALSLFGALRFTREILGSAQLLPRADRLTAVMEWVAVISMMLSPVLSYHLVIVPLSLLTTLLCVQLIVMGVLALLRGSRPARYFLVAFLALLLGAFTYMMKSFGLLPHNAFTQNAFQIGSLVEMVLLSLALGSRMGDIKRRNHIDELTGLYNRRFFDEQLPQEYQKALRRSQPLSLLVMDIDNFKAYNDSLGHIQGDKALRAVAKVLRSSTRKPGMACRYGGEEFSLIMPGATSHEAAVLAERIRAKVEEETVGRFNLSVSIGHATLSAGNFASGLAMFDAADAALYQAKAAGRNCVLAYMDTTVA